MAGFITVLISRPTNDDNCAFRESRKFYPVHLHVDLHIFNLTSSVYYWSKLGIWLWPKGTFASLPRGTKYLYKHFTKCFSIWDLCHLHQCHMQHIIKAWGKKDLLTNTKANLSKDFFPGVFMGTQEVRILHLPHSAGWRSGHQQYKITIENNKLQNLPKIWHNFPNNIK